MLNLVKVKNFEGNALINNSELKTMPPSSHSKLTSFPVLHLSLQASYTPPVMDTIPLEATRSLVEHHNMVNTLQRPTRELHLII